MVSSLLSGLLEDERQVLRNLSRASETLACEERDLECKLSQLRTRRAELSADVERVTSVFGEYRERLERMALELKKGECDPQRVLPGTKLATPRVPGELLPEKVMAPQGTQLPNPRPQAELPRSKTVYESEDEGAVESGTEDEEGAQPPNPRSQAELQTSLQKKSKMGGTRKRHSRKRNV